MRAFIKLTKRNSDQSVLLNTDYIIKVEVESPKRGEPFVRLIYVYGGSRDFGETGELDVAESFERIETMLKEVGKSQ